MFHMNHLCGKKTLKEIPKQQQRSKIDPGNDHHHYYGYYGGGGGCWGLKKIHDLNAPYPYNHIIRATSNDNLRFRI
ncbi:hypothetical protein DERP_006038 [Dermatophagoides pteronyssinus]|uniref:Uncharacterized protein n=1 Tax=Dermatophagoides pteronyssinus TaxID=6956 RepID=A0ABQ8JSM4_DERPT|nr:hypothetical protein DERP_006038 [Dermatophagoides pteronyssinus]